MTSDPYAVCPKGHKAKKAEIQVQSTELEFEGGEGKGPTLRTAERRDVQLQVS